MWEIHTFGNGDVIASALMGIRLFMMTGPYAGLLLLAALILAALAIGRVALEGGQKLLPLFFGVMVIAAIGTQISVDVIVVDEVNPDVADQVVQGVPIAVALPAYVSGYAGWKFTSLAETAFGVPLTYNGGKATMNRPLFDLQKILGAEIRDGGLEESIESYLMYCIFPDMELDPPLAGAPTIDQLRAAPVILTALATTDAARTVGSTGIACADYYTTVLVPGFTTGSPGYDKSRQYLQTQLQVTTTSPVDDAGLGDQIIANMLPVVGQTGLDLINNAMIFKAWQYAMTQYNAMTKNVTTSVADLQKSLSLNLKQQAFSTSLIVQKMVPMLRTMVEGIVYVSTPVVLVLAMTPAMGAVLGVYVKIFLWLQTWGPLYAIVNLVVYHEGKARLSTMTSGGTGFGSVNLSSYDSYVEFASMLNSAAGDYIWMVPIIGWGLVWGGSSIGSALSGAGRGVQETGSRIAGEFAEGRGQTMLEGRGLRWEKKTQLADGTIADGVLGHASGSHMTMAPSRGSFGMTMVDQAGTMTMRGQDGSVTSLAANGSMTVQTPYGTYSKTKDGKLASGVFRGNIYDPETGRTMFMQQEVRGDETYSRGVYRDASGREHQVEQVQNQASGQQVHRLDSMKFAGFEGVEETRADGTKLFTTKRTGPGTIRTQMGEEISGEMVQEDTYISQPGVAGGYRHVAGKAHKVSKDGGEQTYAVARPGGSGEKEDIISRPGTAFAVAGTDSNVVDKNRFNSNGLAERSVEGPGGIVGNVKGAPGVLVRSDGQEYFLEGASFSGEGIELDKNGNPKEGSAVTAIKETGSDRIQASGRMEKDSESGQLVMRATNLSFSRKIGGESSGRQIMVPIGGGNFLVLNSGESKHFGNPYNPKTPWNYTGEVVDFQTGAKSWRTMRFDGQDVYSSTGEAGSKETKILGDGSTMIIDGNMYLPQGAKYTRTWPSRTAWSQVGKDKDGHPIVEPRTFSQRETGTIRASAGKPPVFSDKNDEIIERSARGDARLAGSVVEMDKGDLVGKDGRPLVAPHVDGAGDVHLLSEKAAVFIPSGGTESTAIDVSSITKGPDGKPASEKAVVDPQTGAKSFSHVNQGQNTDVYRDQVQFHEKKNYETNFGTWFLEAAKAAKHMDSDALTEKYGAWAGSLGDLMRLERFDPENGQDVEQFLKGLEFADKVGDVADKTLSTVFRYGGILRAAKQAKRTDAFRGSMEQIQRERNDILRQGRGITP